MRIVLFFLFASITTGWVLVLNTDLQIKGKPVPAFGKFLSPQHGLWQNAEPIDEDFSGTLIFGGLAGKVDVYLDDRLVPHIFAENENDVYFIQGYFHAKFRLWQMELQTLSAAGRASEVVGDIALNHDREFRRLGMVFAAQNSLTAMEEDPMIKSECDAYTAGINAYIDNLPESKLPLEYKLLGYKPERWNNLKTALFLKYMSYDLAGRESDFEMTNAKNYFDSATFKKLFPVIQDSLDPIIPKGTLFSKPSISLKIPLLADSLYFKTKAADVVPVSKPDRNNGSNNWAVSGSKTANGAPILCNDPHLGLNLPSLWIEMQLSTPGFNAYGASFPGAPGIIIGFNDHCAFGFTNGGRDVRDYYEIVFKDKNRKEYLFNNDWKKTEFRIEKIKIKGKPDFYDTVAYTLFGPVMYDPSFAGKRNSGSHNYAVCWTAHNPSNELLIFNMLNKAKDYGDYSKAVVNLHTPGQNCLFASKAGDIAIRTQGEFPAKWSGQGDFIMPGTDSAYLWQGIIPDEETPFQYNPERGFVSSANQRPVDTAYPYYLGRDYPSPRGLIINRRLANMNNITVQDMMKLQTDNYNVFAEMAAPFFTKLVNKNDLSPQEVKYKEILDSWNFVNDINEKGPTIFTLAWKYFKDTVYNDDYRGAPEPIAFPMESTLLEGILRDSAYPFVDDIHTPQTETLSDMLTAGFKRAVQHLKVADPGNSVEWGTYKDTRVEHLLKIPAFSRLHLPIGGGTHVINATTKNHGPSWRMIVNLTSKTEAYGIYPGGQSGNPGSKYYADFIDSWAAGKYYPLWMMTTAEVSDPRVKWKVSCIKK